MQSISNLSQTKPIESDNETTTTVEANLNLQEQEDSFNIQRDDIIQQFNTSEDKKRLLQKLKKELHNSEWELNLKKSIEEIVQRSLMKDAINMNRITNALVKQGSDKIPSTIRKKTLTRIRKYVQLEMQKRKQDMED